MIIAVLQCNSSFVAFGDAAGETLGPNGVLPQEGDSKGVTSSYEGFNSNHFQTRHAAQTTLPARVKAKREVDPGFASCHVLVIRRDSNANVHHHAGITTEILLLQ